MTRFMAAAYVLASVLAWTSVPAQTMPTVDVVVMAEASTPEAALHAAWDRADTELDHQCLHRGGHSVDMDGGTEQLSPVDGGYRAEIFAGGTCR